MNKIPESPVLQGLAKDIAAKSAEVQTKYDVVLADGYTPTEAEREEIKTLNKEIEGLETKYAERYELETGRKAVEDRQNQLRSPQRGTGSYATEDRPTGSKSLGAQVLEDPAFKSYVEGNAKVGTAQARVEAPRVEIKSLLTGASDASAGAMVRREYDATVPLPMRPLSIRDIIDLGATGSDLVEFVRELSRTNNAAVVAEAIATAGGNGVKPESGFVLEIAQSMVKTIATWIPASRRALADAAQIRTMIDGELRFMVNEKFEGQVVAGDGAGENFTGVINTTGLTAQAYDTDILTTTRKARTKCRVTGRAVPTAYVMNPLDWETIDLLKDGEQRYYFGGPTVLGTPRLWGVPVVEHEDMPQGRSIMGDWKTVKVWDREAAQIYASDSHADFFIRNLFAILCEMRAAMGVKRPAALVDIDLTP